MGYRYRNVDDIMRPFESVPGVTYRGDEFAKFPSLIAGTTWVEQPGHCLIAAQSAFVWCDTHAIKISVARGYEVDASAVVAAEAIERTLTTAPLERVEPLDNKYCIRPKYYPDFFA
jgi:hypothetical protein